MEKAYTTTSARGYMLKVKEGVTDMVNGAGGKIRMKTLKPAIYAKLNFMEKFVIKEQAEKYNVSSELLHKVLFEAAKDSTALWEWSKRPVSKIQKDLEVENTTLRDENSKLLKELEALRNSDGQAKAQAKAQR